MKDTTNAAAWPDDGNSRDAGPKLTAQRHGWLLPSAFWIPGWNYSSHAAHLPFYFWLVDAIRPRLLVDLVRGRPDDYLALCQAAKQLNYGAACFGLTDVFDKRDLVSDPASPCGYHKAHFDSISHLEREPEQIFDAIGARTIDLLRIDGREMSKRLEPRQWLARLSPRGVVIILHPEHLSPSWQKVLKKRRSFALHGKSNIELIAATGTYPPELFPAFDDGGDPIVTVMRSTFEHLGSSLRARALHRDTAAFASRVETSLAYQSAATDLLRAEKHELAEKIERQTLVGVRQQGRIATLEQYVEQFRAEVLRLQEYAIKTQSDIQRIAGERDLEVERLQHVIADRDAEIRRISTYSHRLRSENAKRISALDEKIAEGEDQILNLSTLVSEGENENARLNGLVNTLQKRVVDLENTLNHVFQSTAWRMTTPFRLFFRRFPKTARLLRQAIKLVWWTLSLRLVSRLTQVRRRRLRPAVPAITAPDSDDDSRHPPVDARDCDDRVNELTSRVSPLAVPTPPPDRADEVPQLAIGLEREWARIQHVENRVHQLASVVELERHRIDYALLGVDGMLKEIELYHNARAKPEYNRVFERHSPLVSVCVSTMNRSDILIERCLHSLINQSYRNLQIVVVGDHCTDDTGSRIARLRDDRILFHNLPSRGPYPPPGTDRWMVAGTNALNAAMSMCEGQFITHLDDDDVANIDRIETLTNAAQQHKADFCWHPFWCENKDGTWFLLGDGRFELAQITTGSIFYHHYFKKFPWDVFAYRTHEPGDWNRLRKIRSLRPNLHFVDRPLMFHYSEGSQRPFIARNGEMFVE